MDQSPTTGKYLLRYTGSVSKEMERKNSKSKRKNRIRKLAVFLRPDIARLHPCRC